MNTAPTRACCAALASILFAATGCWPAAPIAAMVRANRSGSRHHPATVTIQGTIVTDPTVFPPSPPFGPLPPAGSGPLLDLSATEVDFGLTGTDLVVQVRDTLDGELSVTSITATPLVGPDTMWLGVELLGDGKTIHVSADRTMIAVDGPYQAQVDVVSNGRQDSFKVDVTKGGSTPTPIGSVIVDILADDGVTRIARVTATAADGYVWSIPDLPLGSYFIEAGVDLNSDEVIGEKDEPFGAYPNSFDPRIALEADGVSALNLDLVVVK